MATGNIGNLLQHFVAIKTAERLLAQIGVGKSVLYIDTFAMAPWEEFETGPKKEFLDLIAKFPRKASHEDLVARTFLSAWRQKYSGEKGTERNLRQLYPNTAVLLRTAFPNYPWEMLLHEIDENKRVDLNVWAAVQSPGIYRVDGNWRQSPLIEKGRVVPTQPVFLMLDPYKILGEQDNRGEAQGYLPSNQLRCLVGQHCLNLETRPELGSAAPAVITAFSYSDSDQTIADKVVRHVFARGWAIERVCTGAGQVNFRASYHQAWIVTDGLQSQHDEPSCQDQWDDWVKR